MHKTGKLLILVAILGAMAWAPRPGAVSAFDLFSEKVAPIFEANCTMCHGAGVQRSGLDLRTEAAILKGGTRGPSVIPGKPDESLLIKLVMHKEEPAMPQGMDKLSAADIEVLRDWVAKMAPAKTMAAAPETIPVRQQGYTVNDKDRQFWSFVKPVRPAVPKVALKDRRWVRNEIDAFVIDKLAKNGLKPNPPATPRELLRRVYFDLIGLPPSPEEMAEFLKNPSDSAYEKVVDKLLASQHYGERWGRHWLDLARFADSGGYEFDYDRPHAWRFRDYVIRSFNEDKPYDQFIREQLANDQIKPNDPEALIATGFCRNGPTVDNAVNEETMMDELDDMVATTSSVFLGMTVGCARCHDHKYDPIPQRDYYRLQAVFYPYQKVEKPLVSEAEVQAHKARNKEIDALVKPYREKIAEIERPVREKLMAEKIEFHVRLAENSSGFGGKTREEFAEETARRLRKEVNLQPEEIDPLLTPEQIKARKEVQTEIEKINKTRPKLLPAVMGVNDKANPGKAHLLKRGDWRNKGEEVNPGYPVLFSNGVDLSDVNRRKQLADWIASPDNPLTARVAVNRIWQYHFGKGIVRTPSDFGATGDRPTHPELLDWLAVTFATGKPEGESGRGMSAKPNPQSASRNPQFKAWSWKSMHRMILLSSAYRMSSQFNEAAATKDNENKLFWRMNPRRLEAEIIRDSILSVSGKLNPEMFGPGIYPRIDPDIINTGSRPRWPLDAKDEHATFRRSVYIFVKRSVILPLIEVFDCPATVVPGPVRAVSTVSPQALALMNNQFVLEQAGFLAERLVREAGADPKAQIDRAFQIALARKPTVKEIEWSLGFLQNQTKGHADRKTDKPEAAALRDFCHAMLNLNEFLYVD